MDFDVTIFRVRASDLPAVWFLTRATGNLAWDEALSVQTFATRMLVADTNHRLLLLLPTLFAWSIHFFTSTLERKSVSFEIFGNWKTIIRQTTVVHFQVACSAWNTLKCQPVTGNSFRILEANSANPWYVYSLVQLKFLSLLRNDGLSWLGCLKIRNDKPGELIDIFIVKIKATVVLTRVKLEISAHR